MIRWVEDDTFICLSPMLKGQEADVGESGFRTFLDEHVLEFSGSTVYHWVVIAIVRHLTYHAFAS